MRLLVKARRKPAVGQLSMFGVGGQPTKEAKQAPKPRPKGGPFIGPRGGKWADAAHTIPWKEPEAAKPPPKGEVEFRQSGGKWLALHGAKIVARGKSEAEARANAHQAGYQLPKKEGVPLAGRDEGLVQYRVGAPKKPGEKIPAPQKPAAEPPKAPEPPPEPPKPEPKPEPRLVVKREKPAPVKPETTLSPHEFWGTLKPGDRFHLTGGYRGAGDKDVWVVVKSHGDGELEVKRLRARKTERMKIDDQGRVAKADYWGHGWGQAVYTPKPHEKPEKPAAPAALPEAPADPHELYAQARSLYGKIHEHLGGVKGPKAAKHLAEFAAVVHAAAALKPVDDDGAQKVAEMAQRAKWNARDYLRSRMMAATAGERKERKEKETVREEAIAHPADTPIDALPRPEPSEAVSGDSEAAELFEHLRNRRIVDSYTIPDYPIGRGYRGQMKVWVEHKPGHGWRVMSQTTDRSGRWNKPKGGTYSPARTMIVEPQGDERNIVLSLDAYGESIHLGQIRGQGEPLTAKGKEVSKEIIDLARSRWVSDNVEAGTSEELQRRNEERLAVRVEQAKSRVKKILTEAEYRFNAVAGTADPDRLGSQKRRSYETSQRMLAEWGIDASTGRPKTNDRGEFTSGRLGQIASFLRRHGHGLDVESEPVAESPKVGADRVAELKRMQDAKPTPQLTPHQRKLGQFMTPHHIAYSMAEKAGVLGQTVLDPTAGEGRLLKYAREQGAKEVMGVELDSTLAKFAGVQHGSFLDVPAGQMKADVLLINPPFTMGGPNTAEIVGKAINEHWTGKGKAALILPAGPSGDKMLEPYRHMVTHQEDMPEDAFKKEGTGVRSRLYILEKPMSKSLWSGWLSNLLASPRLTVGTGLS
jgi:hypothetical protein